MINAVVLSLALAATASAHGIVTDIKLGSQWVKSYNPFQDAYQNPAPQRITWAFPSAGNGPVEDVTSRDIVCNKGATAAPISASVAAGSDISFFWTEWPESHRGPSMTYLANCNGDCSKADPTTLSFFKIQHEGLLPSGKWASDEIIANNNTVNARIPSDIAPGNYLLRHELLALHSGGQLNGAQFYPMCANLVITGGGSAKPAGVKFPGAYKPTDPGIQVDIYNNAAIKAGNYVIPGPAVYGGGGSGGSAPSDPEPTPEPVPEPEPEVPEPQPEVPETPEPTPTEIPTQPTVVVPQPTVIRPPTTSVVPLPSVVPSKPSVVPQPDTEVPEKTSEEARQDCLRAINVCIAQAQSKNGGDVSAGIQKCELGREKCWKMFRRVRVKMARR